MTSFAPQTYYIRTLQLNLMEYTFVQHPFLVLRMIFQNILHESHAMLPAPRLVVPRDVARDI